MAFVSVRATESWPIRSGKVRGRHLRGRERCMFGRSIDLSSRGDRPEQVTGTGPEGACTRHLTEDLHPPQSTPAVDDGLRLTCGARGRLLIAASFRT